MESGADMRRIARMLLGLGIAIAAAYLINDLPLAWGLTGGFLIAVGASGWRDE